ncbi:MAG: hypothetical protein K0R38_1837 [Polyangiaceae bacterium]|nr:hypothetical protein [Polyangiaceae bacterium]
MLLLFTNGWGVPDRSTLEALRVELSALASALLVVGDDDLFYLNARPERRPSALPAALESQALSALRQTYGGSRRGPTGVTLSLVEPDGCERFRLSRKVRGGVPEALLEALQIARQSVDLSGGARVAASRELLFYSLVGALNLVLSDVAAPEQAAQTARA